MNRIFVVARSAFTTGRIVPAILALVLTSAIATAAMPGPQRAFFPKIYGLKKIDKGVFTDAGAQSIKILSFIGKARKNVKEFYGELKAEPVFIVCTTQQCSKRFGIRTRGITHGFQLISVKPEGANEIILTHEMVHAELHKRMGYLGLARQTIPAWFDEGLATWLSNDPRFKSFFSAEEIAWAKGMRKRRDLGKLIKQRNYIVAYGAAAAAVSEINAKIGRKGLLRIIDRVTLHGENFNAVLQDEGV